ncbi:MAG: tetratricopeptide repeat protein [Methylophilaceae bacterium]|nr:tetratricopeptide repeat protein [Methylophilaceae bacterium]
MAYDLEEQEKIDALRDWWKRNRSMVLIGVTVGLLALIGYEGWKYWRHNQALQASAQFEALSQLKASDTQQIRSIAGQLMEKYANTPYAARAALLAAHASYAAGDTKSARAQMEWAKNNGRDASTRSIAQLQLAGLLFEEKKYDEALKVLHEKHDPAFDGLVSDLRGDILAVQGKTAEARKAYTEALTKLDANGRFHQYTAQKLDALGG